MLSKLSYLPAAEEEKIIIVFMFYSADFLFSIFSILQAYIFLKIIVGSNYSTSSLSVKIFGIILK